MKSGEAGRLGRFASFLGLVGFGQGRRRWFRQVPGTCRKSRESLGKGGGGGFDKYQVLVEKMPKLDLKA